MSNPQWQDMSRDERVQYLTPLIGKEVQVVTTKNLERQQSVFGEDAPIEWQYGTLKGLRIINKMTPGFVVEQPYKGFSFALTRPTNPQTEYTFDDVCCLMHVIEKDEAPANTDIQELVRLRTLRTDLADFVEARKDLPQYLDICQLLSLFIAKSEG